MSDAWQRHDLLRVDPEAWSRLLESQPRLAQLSHLAGWAAQGWPLIVRRRLEQDDPRMIPLALPLPPACGKLRLSFQFAPQDIRGQVPPVTLRAARQDTPVSWHPTVNALLLAAEQTGVEPRVFGSLLWQHLTRLPYLSATSDLDLLWPVTDAKSATDLVRRVAAIAAAHPVTIDGEILLPAGGGVQWREWHAGGHEVLVKTSCRVELRPMASLFSAGTLVG